MGSNKKEMVEKAKERAMLYNRLNSNWRFVDVYYFVNVLVIASFSLIRYWFDLEFLQKKNQGGVSKEGHIWFILVLYLGLKYIRSPNMDVFLSYVFLYTKACILVVGFMCGDYSLSVYYGIVFLVLFLTLKQPTYEGPSNVKYLDPVSFDETVLNSKDKSSSSEIWIVYMYATWCPPCIQISPILSQLSMLYGCNKQGDVVHYAKIDVGRHNQIGKKFNVDTSVKTKSLPTFIMFKNGEVEKRIPSLGTPMTSLGIFEISKLVKLFDLQNMSVSKEHRD